MAALGVASTRTLERMHDGICEKSRELLVSKSTGVTSGWVLNYAITLSVGVAVASLGFDRVAESSATDDMKNAGAPKQGISLAQAVVAFSLKLGVFVLILVAASFSSRSIMGASFLPGRMKKTYAAGLGFIPAWQWKNVISALMVAILGGDVKEHPDWAIAAVVFSIALLTAFIQISLEEWAAGAEPASLLYQVVSQLKTSLGLGLGFALNVLFYAAIGDHVTNIIPQVVYVTTLTTVIALVQYFSKPKLEEMKQTGAMPGLLIRTLNFLIVASNFVVGWAWKGMLDVAFKDMRQAGVQSQLMVSLMMSALMILLVVTLTLTAAKAAGPLGTLEDLCMTASAMNVGWTWADFAMECLRVFKEEERGGQDLRIGEVWLFSLLVVAVASVAALAMDTVIRHVERSDQELLVK
eukprot:TRINITY_DN93379_c0_g1_i1.p1 TRINITY_DN93379_c0_g1~~TRINITY_DN93379_c0_g1_i1.p1  ORF type:complete len:410 (+),score=93.04 TRINITY_DN93379_c0_g1_i1:85-1314(+)